MNDYAIVPSSPLVTEVKDDSKNFGKKYPFDKLSIGQSFLIPFNGAPTDALIRNTASRAGKKLEMKFKVVKHNDHNECYEIARIK